MALSISTKVWLKIGAVGLIVGLGAWAFNAWRNEIIARAQLAKDLMIEKALIEQQAMAIKGLNEQIAERDKKTASDVLALQQLKTQKPASASETAAEIAKYLQLPSAPKVAPAPPSASQAASTTGAVAASTAPGPAQQEGNGEGQRGNTEKAPIKPGLLFTSDQAEQLRQAAIGCATAQKELTACELDLKDYAAKESAYRKQINDIGKERDDAVKMVHGGSLLRRLGHEAKEIAIAAGIGAAIGYAAHGR